MCSCRAMGQDTDVEAGPGRIVHTASTTGGTAASLRTAPRQPHISKRRQRPSGVKRQKHCPAAQSGGRPQPGAAAAPFGPEPEHPQQGQRCRMLRRSLRGRRTHSCRRRRHLQRLCLGCGEAHGCGVRARQRPQVGVPERGLTCSALLEQVGCQHLPYVWVGASGVVSRHKHCNGNYHAAGLSKGGSHLLRRERAATGLALPQCSDQLRVAARALHRHQQAAWHSQHARAWRRQVGAARGGSGAAVSGGGGPQLRVQVSRASGLAHLAQGPA